MNVNFSRIRFLSGVFVSNIFKNFNPIIRIRHQVKRKVLRPRKFYLINPQYFNIAFFGLISSADSQSDKSTTAAEDQDTIISLIKQCDELFSVGKFEESFKILEPYKNTNNVEILWRLSRALYNMSKMKGITKSDSVSLISEGYKFIEKALKLDENNYAVHKWMAIMVDAKSGLEGIKARIHTLPVFKDHLKKAVDLNPKDATSIYMLGLYMYNIADMSWLQRKIAKTLFDAPPESTFEEALHYFSKAEEVDPNFYSANLLMLGKTYLKLKRLESARFWLKCAISYPVRTDEDKAVILEAEELLEKISNT